MPVKSNKQILDEIEQVADALKGWKDELVLGGGVALIVYDECMAKTNAKGPPEGQTRQLDNDLQLEPQCLV